MVSSRHHGNARYQVPRSKNDCDWRRCTRGAGKLQTQIAVSADVVIAGITAMDVRPISGRGHQQSQYREERGELA